MFQEIKEKTEKKNRYLDEVLDKHKELNFKVNEKRILIRQLFDIPEKDKHVIRAKS